MKNETTQKSGKTVHTVFSGHHPEPITEVKSGDILNILESVWTHDFHGFWRVVHVTHGTYGRLTLHRVYKRNFNKDRDRRVEGNVINISPKMVFGLNIKVTN